MALSLIAVPVIAGIAGYDQDVDTFDSSWSTKGSFDLGETVYLKAWDLDPNKYYIFQLEKPHPDHTKFYIGSWTKGDPLTGSYVPDMTGQWTVHLWKADDASGGGKDEVKSCTFNVNPVVRLYSASITPTTANAGETKSYTITIYNSGSSNKDMGSAQIDIPSGFTGVTITDVSASGWNDWSGSIDGAVIKLDSDSGSDKLDSGEHVHVTFTATAPPDVGVYTWITRGYSGQGWGGDLFDLTGSQPTVTVTAVRYFTATISPTTCPVSTTKTYTITITNDMSSSSGVVLGSAKVEVPSGFTSISSLSVSSPGGKTWTVSLVSGYIKLKAQSTGSPDDRLARGESVSVTFSATAPASEDTYEWTTSAYGDNSWSSNQFNIKGSQPVVTVTVDRYFTATISPTTCLTGETKTYTITITNDMSSSSGVKLGSAEVTIPSGFTSVSIISVSPPSGKTWTKGISSGKINLDAKYSSDELSRGESVSVTFSAKALGTAGTYEWTTKAYGCEEPEFTIVGPQPVVTVYKQYKIIVTATPSGAIPAGAVGGSFKVTYTKFGSVHTAEVHNTQWSECVDSGSSVTLSDPQDPISGGTGIRYAFDHYSPSNPVTMTSNKTVTLYYDTQYRLVVSSGQDAPNPPVGDNWYDSGTEVTASVTSPTTPSGGTRYKCTGWIGTGNVPASGSGVTTTFTITLPSSITWNWMAQYYLTVNTNPSSLDSPNGANWYDAGVTAHVSTDQDVDVVLGITSPHGLVPVARTRTPPWS